jgi:hypothetical protein
MIDYQMTIILNAALNLERTPDGIERFKKDVRSALQKSRPTTLAADDATATHYGQTSIDNYIYSDEVSGAKPRHR